MSYIRTSSSKPKRSRKLRPLTTIGNWSIPIDVTLPEKVFLQPETVLLSLHSMLAKYLVKH